MDDWWDEGPTEAEMEDAHRECRLARHAQGDAVRSALVENACGCWDVLGQHMVGRFVLVAEVIDEDGDSSIFTLSSEGLLDWEADGLLRRARP